MLFTVSVVKRRQIGLAAGAGSVLSCGVCLAVVAAPNGGGQGLCRLWWCLYFCGDTLVVGSGRHSPHVMGSGGGISRLAGNGDHHVRSQKRIVNAASGTQGSSYEQKSEVHSRP